MPVPTNLQNFTVAQLTALLTQSTVYDAQAIISSLRNLGISFPLTVTASGETTVGNATNPTNTTYAGVRSEWMEQLRLARNFGWRGTVGPVAAQSSFAELTNPAGSTVIALVRVAWGGADPTSGSAQRIDATIDNGADIGADVGVANLCPLFSSGVPSTAVCRVKTGNQAGLPASAIPFGISGSGSGEAGVLLGFDTNDFIAIINPSHKLLLFQATVNIGTMFAFMWAEAPAGYQ